ncbi:MAG: hypothetical protein RDU13_11580 [Elusimicrobiales bacterium]|jgi:hypothetical protein|nr:hypothetical protein [Elusimicrobiales bacterium]
MTKSRILFPLVLAFLGATSSAASPRQALVILSGGASESSLRSVLREEGGRVLRAFPPSAFICELPGPGGLSALPGAAVYAGPAPAPDPSCGEPCVLASAVWNSGFPAPAAAPAARVGKRAEKRRGATVLSWVPSSRAGQYDIEISSSPDFSSRALSSRTGHSRYAVPPGSLPPGLYYWRVAPAVEGAAPAWSAAEELEIAPYAAPRRRGRAPAPAAGRMRGRSPVAAAPAPGASWYRLQISSSPDFSAPVFDQSSEEPRFKLSAAPLASGATYYARTAAYSAGEEWDWSETAELFIDQPAPPPGDMRRPRGGRRE